MGSAGYFNLFGSLRTVTAFGPHQNLHKVKIRFVFFSFQLILDRVASCSTSTQSGTPFFPSKLACLRRDWNL